MNKKLIFGLFVVVVLAQIYVPAKMIMNRESVIADGKEYKFRTAPIDPNDPFRGKYIYLQFSDVNVDVTREWERDEVVFLTLKEDSLGFAIPDVAYAERPVGTTDYLEAKVRYPALNKMTIRYPFERFYMDENKALPAEHVYRRARRDAKQTAYALVSIKDGQSVLKDVLINDESIKDIVKRQLEEDRKEKGLEE